MFVRVELIGSEMKTHSPAALAFHGIQHSATTFFSRVPKTLTGISTVCLSLQAKKEKEPAYTVVSEKGEPRSREFVIQCSLDGGAILTQGIGPNKKTAKRKAAEAMLQQLGYSKPQAQQAGLNKDERGWLKLRSLCVRMNSAGMSSERSQKNHFYSRKC